jgi:hypothetical protein
MPMAVRVSVQLRIFVKQLFKYVYCLYVSRALSFLFAIEKEINVSPRTEAHCWRLENMSSHTTN